MGKSKFPGKPSKLVNKKRISVLQSNSFDDWTDKSKVQWFDRNCESQSSPSFGNNTTSDGHKIQKLPSKLPASEPPDGGGGGNHTSTSSGDRCEEEDAKHIRTNGKNANITITKSRNSESHISNHNLSSINNNNKNSAAATDATINITNKGSKVIEISKKDRNGDKSGTNAAGLSVTATIISSENSSKPVKKKTVTFKNILETSDDACAVKKVYNPDNAPLVPIIKRECLSRSVRLARSDCIVRPSRLTEILKNNANNIDKLNSLKFKSASSSLAAAAAAATSNSNKSSNSKNSSKASALDDNSDILSNGSNSSNNNNSNNNSSNNSNNINEGSISNGKKEKSDNKNTSISASAAAASSPRLENIIVDGDKRFVLPKRSNNSCRVIKPNKRFLNDVFESTTKHRSTHATASATHSSQLVKATNSASKSQSSKYNNEDNNDANNNADDDDEDDDDDDDEDDEDDDDDNNNNDNNDIRYGNEYINDNNNCDADHQSIQNSKNQSNHHHHHQSEYQKSEGVKLSRSILKFNTKKLLCNDDDIGSGVVQSMSSKQDGLNARDTLEDLKLNPFVSTGSNNSGLLKNSNQFLFSTMSSSKGILRQPRLQFSETQNSVKEQNKNLLSGISGFSSNLIGSNMGAFQQSCNCGICMTPINSKNLADSRKYGIQCCDICRKFISKITKRSIASIGSSPNVLQCNRGDGTCIVTPLAKASLKNFKKTYKERCSACWLKKCIKNCHFSSGQKNRLKSVLPTSFVEDINTSDSKKSALSIAKPKELGCVSNSAFSNVNIDGNVKKLLDKFKNNRSSTTSVATSSTASALSVTNSSIAGNNLFANTTNTKLINWTNLPTTAENLFAESNSGGGNSINGTNNSRINLVLSSSNQILDDSLKLSTGSSATLGSTSLLSSDGNQSSKATSLPLTNHLAENNTKFGGLPQIKPTVLEKPVIMVDSNNGKNDDIQSNLENKQPSNAVTESTQSHLQDAARAVPDNENSTKLKLRKKDKTAEQQNSTTLTQQQQQQQSSALSAGLSSEPKRQRIDLKGPRVKHVCRSASIVLGQTIATFPEDGGSVLDNMETPPRPESPNNAEVELPTELRGDNCTSCSHTDQQVLGLSPPATPTELDDKIEDATNKPLHSSPKNIAKYAVAGNMNSGDDYQKNKGGKVMPKIDTSKIDLSDDFNMDMSENSQDFGAENGEGDVNKNDSSSMNVDEFSCEGESTTDERENLNENSGRDKKIKFDDISKASKRKLSRQGTLSSTSQNQTANAIVPMATFNSRNLNAFSKKLNTYKELSELRDELQNTIRVSVDFWENYDPAEVSQNGFGIIVTEPVPMRALCFLCGSSGIDGMVFCACCCEPYHQYCVADEYNFKHSSLDETMTNLLDTSINPIENMSLITNRLNWLCPRCTVCYTCNMTSGSKVKCQKCQKYYHTTCLGTSKRLLGADRPLICAGCLKCKSCGTTKVSKFVGNLPMCSQCFKLRKKGNFCPICQKVYEENDFDLKMMECGDCQRWVHAKCEGLSDEQYNLLSTLPENIEFICKKCTFKCPDKKSEWREAVSAEFKSGLLSVVKLLSKSRQACALLKLSPRKKCSFTCVCQNQNAVRNLLFNKNPMSSSQRGKENEENSQGSEDIMNDVYEFTESSNSPIPGGTSYSKCVCSAGRMKSSGTLSLVDIKNKITSSSYVSLAEFNYDMENVITSSNCDELMLTYKEILSETFPWFQNETKACTDALEEDMFDACNFSQHSDDCLDGMVNDGGVNNDQQLSEINLPDDVDDCIYSQSLKNDNRVCMFCKGTGESDPDRESRLLYCGHNSWVHINCAMWSAEVFEEIDGSLQNVHSAISRGRMIKCTVCSNRGATVGCNLKSCGEHYHYPCARKINCAFMTDKTVYCPEHLEFAKRKKCEYEQSFEVNRPVYVELDRRKKKMVEPSKVNFLIGSLHVKNLGRVFPKFSDTNEAIIPVDFHCTRLYWSMKEPWKIVQYTIKTSIQSNIFAINPNGDVNRNFTVDHTGNMNMVQLGLSQITRWHNSLIQSSDEADRATVKQFLEAVGHNLCSADETTTEEEPQNNADLLPPEIKDAIFEDLPHELLDGISMLDIFPKLMVYEDLHPNDFKPESLLVNELSRDNHNDFMAEVDKECNNSNKDLAENSWSIGQAGINHVEDALLSAVRPINGMIGREIKRSKSEVLARNASRSQQRSSSLTWSCKLENNAIKRRKISKGFQDIRLPEGVLLSLGRRKEEFPLRRGSQTEDSNKTKNFTWSAAKKYCQENLITTIPVQAKDNPAEKFRISQLDGMDDPMMSEETTTTTEFRLYDPNPINCPVKCDRCQCTYRTHESFQRHLAQCEPLSTSESESETARTPESDTSVQQSILLDFNKGPHQAQGTFIQNLNQTFPIVNHNTQHILGRQNATNVQIAPLRGQASIQIQNNPVSIAQLNQSNIPNIFLNTQQSQHNLNANNQHHGLGQQFISSIQNLNQFQNNNNNIPTIQMSVDSNGQQIFTIATNNQQQQQTQHIQQQMPQANVISANIITLDKQQKKPKLSPRPAQYATKIKPQKSMMSPKLKKISPQQNQPTATYQSVNQNQMPIFRNQNQNDAQKPIIIQQATQNTNTQPIILQQVANTAPQNIVTYIDNNNQIQYLAMPAATSDFKQPQQQYITANPLVQGNTYLQTDASGNLVLTNGAPGLQMISTGPTLQLAQQQQTPQVIGTLLQPTQCGVMSADQMVLGTTPGAQTTLDVMGNPTMLLTTTGAQPMYYGLETIVQNTVMSSQQFVSTAMQGVLSQNSSFSATTTQVFQASKIEPIVEVPGGYVVLNNVDSMIQQPANQQTNGISANLIQQPTIVQQIQPQQVHTQQPVQQVQQVYNVQQQQAQPTIIQNQQAQQSNQAHITITQQPQRSQQISINAIQPQIRPASPAKPTAKSSPLIVKKIQPHIVNQMANTTAQHTQQPQQQQNFNPQIINATQSGIGTTSLSTIDQSVTPIIITTSNIDNTNNTTIKPIKVNSMQPNQQQILKPKLTTITANPPMQRKMNLIKPLNKISSAPIKPKVVAKPVSPKVVVKSTPAIPQLIAPKPSPANQFTNLMSNPVENRIEITLANTTPDHEPKALNDMRVNNSMQNINKTMQDYMKAQNECVSVSEIPTTILTFSNEVDLNNQILSNNVTSQCYEISNLSSGSLQFGQNNAVYTMANNSTMPSQSMQPSITQQQTQSINLPTSTSIQLPSAPFVSPFGNNIPTNIVNPIPQVPSNNQIVSRPTNRVLPMQAMLQKTTTAIPTPSPTEQKTVKNENAIEKISFMNENKQYKDPVVREFQNNAAINSGFQLIQKTNFENDIVENDNALESNIFMENVDSSDKEDDKIIDKPDLALETSEGNDAFDFISRIRMESEQSPKSCQDVSDDLSDSTAPEVKEKISEILENLENDDCKSSPNLSDHFEEDDCVDEPDDVTDDNNKSFAEQKENITPNIIPQSNTMECFQVSNAISKNLDALNYQKGPKILYEIQSEDGFVYKSTSIIDVWEKVFEAVQMARKAHGLAPLPEGPVADMCGIQMLGLKTNALRYLIEQLPGVERCTKYTTKYHKRELSNVDYTSDCEEYKESLHGSVRCEPFIKRSDYDMFGWLASRHRKQPIQVVVQPSDTECIQRRGTGSNLPMAMKYRTLKETYKDYVGVFRSHIHGRGLYCTKDIEAGEMVIEYAGELIRSTLTDKRERYYDGKGIGCYMFKIDDNLVVDATMRGNAARFINHSCEPNCYSKVVDILGHKHIIIFALRRIVQGEELTYDYKFPFEDIKIPCSCGSKKCRKYLN